ncbi:cysteine dioxygenase family protein [Streptomyces sp. NBC_00503]|uniref:cysteine dioxygenase family protein n=1 Tax=Streptomyces sp. NBC_00503 TaxID=2903659 RepID=UPI002E800BD2|nr:cysteine dioxygenase family protein [Streptomyces sp. NBC_00503]WUD82318.1 cysteine dioxygenase family protein [Streptomyces sp. NBC_00503]
MTTTTPPARTTARMAALVDEIRTVVERGLPPDLTAYLVGERLAPHLGMPGLLAAEQCEGHSDRYRQHVLHAEPDGSFSVVALVWLPGQETAIHDHVSWCVAGVHQGEESELRYRLAPATATSGARLVATEHVVNGPGDVCGFAPPGDIHKVRNSCRTKAISLHVYGADVVRLGSSVRRVYTLPVD